jgi:hypothetical protein
VGVPNILVIPTNTVTNIVEINTRWSRHQWQAVM